MVRCLRAIAHGVHDRLRRHVPHLDRASVHVNPAKMSRTPDQDTGAPPPAKG